MYQDQPSRGPTPGTNQFVAVMLEIQGDEAQGTMRLPVIIQSAENGQVTLRLNHSLPEFMQESLINLKANLYLSVPEEREIVEASGKVAWLKDSGSGRSQTLALELTEPDPEFQKLVRKQIVHSPADIQELWQRWDRARDEDVVGEPLNYHVGLGLMASGIVLNLAGPREPSFLLFTYLLMFLGGLVAGVKNVLPIRWRRAKFL